MVRLRIPSGGGINNERHPNHLQVEEVFATLELEEDKMINQMIRERGRKRITKNIVWHELEKLNCKKDKYIEFKWGKKEFKITRLK